MDRRYTWVVSIRPSTVEASRGWTDPSDDFYVVLASINGKNIRTIIDSGTSIINVPPSEVKDVLQSIDGVSIFGPTGPNQGHLPVQEPRAEHQVWHHDHSFA